MGKELEMAKNNNTPDRIQTIWNMIGGDDVADRLIAGTAKVVIEMVRRLNNITPFSVTVPATERNVQDFFGTRDGLWISDNFRDLILAGAQDGLLVANKSTRGHADLAEEANDAEIGAELPKGHVFTDVNVFLAFLAYLIELQWLNQTEGVLLNTDYRANIFYVEIAGTVFTVGVRWNAGDGEWYCYAVRPDADRWGAGNRAFSATGA
jgi:hypothetical protein